MGKKQPQQAQTIKDPLTIPIRKNKSFQNNLNMFLKIMYAKFSNISTKQYLSYIHKYIAKYRETLKKRGSQKEIVQTLRKVKICKACDQWAKIKQRIIKCQMCQDYYHLCCAQNWDKESQLCPGCQAINSSETPRRSLTRRSIQQYNCAKCANKKNKKISSKAQVVCMKCDNRYHMQCFGKKNQVVCYQCHQQILNEIKKKQLKQSTLMQHGFKRTSQGKTENKKENVREFSFSNLKEKYQQQYTRANSFTQKNFKNQFPKMSEEQILSYKKDLVYAIYSKNMQYTQQLQPIGCQIQEDNQNSLDFGLQIMCPSDYVFYKKYKQQPIGPFKIKKDENMGYDVKADKTLPKGMIVCQYIGEVVTLRQALKDRNNDSLMEYKIGLNSQQTLYIRPKKFTNIARFINGINNNHPQKANIKTLRTLVQGKPAILLYTSRVVKQGQSLLYDYNGSQKNTYPTEDFV